MMSIESYVQAFSPADYSKTEWCCSVPGCNALVEENSKSSWCDSCRANPAAVLEKLGLPTEEENAAAGQTGSVGYCPIG